MRVPTLDAIPKLKHGFFTRADGVSSGVYESMNCAFGKGDEDKNVRENRSRACATLGIHASNLITATQEHTNIALVVTKPFLGGDTPVADALVTRKPGLILGVLTADCAPILLVDPKARVIAACHAGSKGALAGIIEATVEAMESCGAAASGIIAAIGPCIGNLSYEVQEEFRTPYLEQDPANEDYFSYNNTTGTWFFDLPAYVTRRLEALNVAQVLGHMGDTYTEQRRFFSYRYACQNTDGVCGRHLSAIALTP